MRCFKHMTDSYEGEFLAAVLDEFGPEAYGVWWLILERIASQMDGSGKTTATYSIKNWARHCHISTRKLRKFCGFFTTFQDFSAEFSEKTLKIDVPSLARSPRSSRTKTGTVGL